MKYQTALALSTDSDQQLQLDHFNPPGTDAPSLAPPLTNFDLEALFDLGDDDVPLLPSDLSDIETTELRILCNRMFREMNKDFPRFGAKEDYEVLHEELDLRSGN